jgi:hypothetical protein
MPALNFGEVLLEYVELGSPDERGIAEDPEILVRRPLRQKGLFGGLAHRLVGSCAERRG